MPTEDEHARLMLQLAEVAIQILIDQGRYAAAKAIGDTASKIATSSNVWEEN